MIGLPLGVDTAPSMRRKSNRGGLRRPAPAPYFGLWNRRKIRPDSCAHARGWRPPNHAEQFRQLGDLARGSTWSRWPGRGAGIFRLPVWRWGCGAHGADRAQYRSCL